MKPFYYILLLFLTVHTLEAQNNALPAAQTSTVPDTRPSEEMPDFPGGWMELKKFLTKNLQYPQIAMDSAYEGRCYLKFVVDTVGVIKDIKVLRGVPHCPACDKEAIRLMKLMPRWKPGKRDGKPVDVQFTMPVEFKLM